MGLFEKHGEEGSGSERIGEEVVDGQEVILPNMEGNTNMRAYSMRANCRNKIARI